MNRAARIISGASDGSQRSCRSQLRPLTNGALCFDCGPRRKFAGAKPVQGWPYSADLYWANLYWANRYWANPYWADLYWADL